jgi:CheY-like chemotaxis protein
VCRHHSLWGGGTPHEWASTTTRVSLRRVVISLRIVIRQPARHGGRVQRFMIVDDNERFLAVARRLLGHGLDVVATATTQHEALKKAEELRPDVVIVDINLGDESGFDVTRRLVDDLTDLRPDVVLISTRDPEDFADLIAASPAVGFLPKSQLSAMAVRELVG